MYLQMFQTRAEIEALGYVATRGDMRVLTRCQVWSVACTQSSECTLSVACTRIGLLALNQARVHSAHSIHLAFGTHHSLHLAFGTYCRSSSGCECCAFLESTNLWIRILYRRKWRPYFNFNSSFLFKLPSQKQS